MLNPRQKIVKELLKNKDVRFGGDTVYFLHGMKCHVAM